MYIQKYYKVIRVIKEPTPLYIENVSDSDGVFILQKNGATTHRPNLMYRIGDNGEWVEYDTTNLPRITVPSGSKIYFRGDNVNGFSIKSYYYNFYFSKSFNIGGYITSLLALDNFNTISDIPQHSFCQLFKNQSNLLNVNDLKTSNIINVGIYGLSRCFGDCTSLTTAPNFSNVTTVDTYGFADCFENCTSLTTAPNFSNVTTVDKYGFDYCFSGCTLLQLVYAPNISTWSTNSFNSWLKNVSPTGVMYKPTGLEIPTGTSGVPEGWTTVDY